jgi:hypothetical protein
MDMVLQPNNGPPSPLPPSLVDVFIELLRPITRVCVCVMRARLVAERVRLLTESDILLLFSQLVTAPYLNRQKCRSHPLRGETSFLVRMMDVEASETICSLIYIMSSC